MALLSDEEIESKLQPLGGWERDTHSGTGGDAITRDFKEDDFKGSVAFVNRVMPIAEAMNHHPDLAISRDTVTVTISTQSEGGLTDNDFDLAARIDALG